MGDSSPSPSPSQTLRGIAGSPGVAIGRAVVVRPSRLTFARRPIAADQVVEEIRRFRASVQLAQNELRETSARLGERKGEASILEAYLVMVGDEMLADAVISQISDQKRCAEWAVSNACESISRRLASVDDVYLRERSHDINFVGERILRCLIDVNGESDRPKLIEPSILIAHDLSPADTAALLHEPVTGFVTELGTGTSHTAIMARALEIPSVVGVNELLSHVTTGDWIIVDGLRGDVLICPTQDQWDEARMRSARYVAFAKGLQQNRGQQAVTKDGVLLHVCANVELPDEATLACEEDVDGIGLYRTEFLYIDKVVPPTEDEQYEIFRFMAETMHPKPVTLRTFDIGGDKFVSTFQLPVELNPMLGLRAVRLALSRPEIFAAHLRAMVRATAHGNVRIMIPMVASLDELRQVKKLLDQAKIDVKAKGLACADEIPLGIMVEVPSTAIMVDLFAQEASFLSLGTNDLIQYTLAVDRTSQSLAYLASSFEPAILRLIAGVVRAGKEHKKTVSICGAMASDPLAALLLLGLGVREFSMEMAAVFEIKETFRRVTLSEAQAVAERAMLQSTAREVEHCVAEAFAPRLYDLLSGDS